LLSTFIHTPLFELLARFCIDIAAVLVLIFGMYYRRHQDKELVTAAALFNIFVFAVLTILSSVEFSVAAGFGLFAILALFTLRSEPITKIEITYFFGSVAVAVICSVQGTTLPLIAATVVLVLLGAYVFDHPRIVHSVENIKITFDQIHAHALSDPKVMNANIAERLGVEVVTYEVRAIDYFNDTVSMRVFYRKR